MLREKRDKQQAMQVVILEQMVPENHLLRKIDRSVDFSFIRKLCEPLYCPDNGRPAIDPEVLFRMLFVGYLYGIKSERRLEEEVNYNMAYKWFCGLELTEKAPDASTISVNRRRKFREANIAEQVFEEILRQAIAKGLVGGKIFYADSTHVKAKANKHKKQTVTVEITPREYMEELDAQIDVERKKLGKKPFDRDDPPEEPPTREIQQSKNDPESGQLHKEGKPDGFHYSEHRTVDSKHNVILDVYVTAANLNDVDALPEMLRRLKGRLGTLPKYLGLDAGYHNAKVSHLLEKLGIQGILGYRRHTHKGAHYGKYRFTYDSITDAYLCPEKQSLPPRTVNRQGYKEYWSSSKICKDCPRRKECFSEKASRRLITRHLWQDALDQITAFTKTPAGKKLYYWRKETVERSFAEGKENHGLRTARMLGRAGMQEQSFLSAAVQNMKRIVRFCFSFLLLQRMCKPGKIIPILPGLSLV